LQKSAIAEKALRGRHKSIPGGCGRGVLFCTAFAVISAALALVTAAAVAADPPAPAAASAAAATPPPAAAQAAAAQSQPTQLDAYLDHLRTLRATFVQTLADGQGREIDRASGTIIVERPGKFSWDIHPQSAGGANSAGQLLVCDGRNLWFFDRDLEQVTVKPVDAALSATPALLLSGAVDVRKNFTITPAGERLGLQWVLVEPHGAEADFREALFGFDKGELKRMILEDKLDQTATVLFDKVERNAPVSAAEVSFTPPKGADVIGTPRK
jgi:outer membrane lipoprotein carrier protein